MESFSALVAVVASAILLLRFPFFHDVVAPFVVFAILVSVTLASASTFDVVKVVAVIVVGGVVVAIDDDDVGVVVDDVDAVLVVLYIRPIVH